MEIHYDEEADYLEIFFGEPKTSDYGEHVNEDIVLFRYEDNNELYGIGIFNFRKRAKNLQDILVNLPFKVKLQPLQ